MPSPDRNAGGTPGDWETSKKGACDKILGIGFLIGIISVAQLLGWINLAVNGI